MRNWSRARSARTATVRCRTITMAEQGRELHGLPRRDQHDLSALRRTGPRHPQLAQHAGRLLRSRRRRVRGHLPDLHDELQRVPQRACGLPAANAMPVTGAGCHLPRVDGSWDFTVTGTTFHEAYDETTNCQTCHARPASPRRRSPISTTASRPSASASSMTARTSRSAKARSSPGRSPTSSTTARRWRSPGLRPSTAIRSTRAHDGVPDRAGGLPVRAEHRGRGYAEHAAQLRAG